MIPDNDDRMGSRPDVVCISLGPMLAAQDIELPAGIELVARSFTTDSAALTALQSGSAPLPTAIERAPLRRRIEFLVGRHCAAAALRALGHTGDVRLPIDNRRLPVWPAGFVGSISHGDGRAVAAAAGSRQATLIGVDIQTCLSSDMARRLAPHVCSEQERGIGKALDIEEAVWISRLWAIKESCIKALGAATREVPDFRAIQICDADRRSASVALRGSPGRSLSVLHASLGLHALALCQSRTSWR